MESEPNAEHFSHGVTFREFAEFILAQDPQKLDSHWQPQVFYLVHVPLTHIYDVKSLHLLEEDLRAHVGANVALPKMNVSRPNDDETEHVPVAADLLPKDLSNAHRLTLESFLPEALKRRLMEYYAADLTIYQQVRKAAQQRIGDR